MWRIQGLFGRAFRCHGNASTLRLSNHIDDEVIGSSLVLSTSRSQKGEDGEQQQKKKRTTEFCYTELPRYTALDAVGWGAAAVLFMQICRKVHSKFSSVGDLCPSQSNPLDMGLAHKNTHKILLYMLWKGDVLPRVMCVNSGGQRHLENSASCSSEHISVPTSIHQQEETLTHNLDYVTEDGHPDACHTDIAGDEDLQEKRSLSIEEAELNLKAVADNSVPIVLNIMGLKSAEKGDYKAAFEFFQASAQQNYSKAQYNIGVCYEKGLGVPKDLNKALQYYGHAASAGHIQAKYCYAKHLLNCDGQQNTDDRRTDTAASISLLQDAAAAGHVQAQLHLGVLFSRGPDADELKSVQYFTKAAQSGNSTGLLFLGQCYEKGFGVPQCNRTAVTYYEQAIAKGNEPAKNKLRDLQRTEVLRSIQSAPCLSVLNRVHLSSMVPQEYKVTGADTKQPSYWSAQALPHSWSTGSLIASPPFCALTFNSSGNGVAWILGVG